jgi:hypothetical protein
LITAVENQRLQATVTGPDGDYQFYSSLALVAFTVNRYKNVCGFLNIFYVLFFFFVSLIVLAKYFQRILQILALMYSLAACFVPVYMMLDAGWRDRGSGSSSKQQAGVTLDEITNRVFEELLQGKTEEAMGQRPLSMIRDPCG